MVASERPIKKINAGTVVIQIKIGTSLIEKKGHRTITNRG